MPRPVVIALFVVYLVALALIGFWPQTVDRGVEGLIWEVAGWCSWNGCSWLNYEVVERAANVILFLPFGLLVALLLSRRWRWSGIAVCIAASGGIELGQLLFLPGRYPSLSDLITNSIGGALGVLIVLAATAVRRRREQEANLDRVESESLS